VGGVIPRALASSTLPRAAQDVEPAPLFELQLPLAKEQARGDGEPGPSVPVAAPALASTLLNSGDPL
jgi:hypothetical protein